MYKKTEQKYIFKNLSETVEQWEWGCPNPIYCHMVYTQKNIYKQSIVTISVPKADLDTYGNLVYNVRIQISSDSAELLNQGLWEKLTY